jgi:hypothetical protein
MSGSGTTARCAWVSRNGSQKPYRSRWTSNWLANGPSREVIVDFGYFCARTELAQRTAVQRTQSKEKDCERNGRVESDSLEKTSHGAPRGKTSPTTHHRVGVRRKEYAM